MSYQDRLTSYTNSNETTNYSENKYTLGCCCISNKWYFEHTGLASMKEYDNTANNYCICLDCCTWCLEFKMRICSEGKKPIICYLCCCSIYFIE